MKALEPHLIEPRWYPILFSAPMVRAILERRKFMTSRIIDPQPALNPGQVVDLERLPEGRWGFTDNAGTLHKSSKGGPGDYLWVRETWRAEKKFDHLKPSELPQGVGVEYLAGGDVDGFKPLHAIGKVRPSIFLPRWASRINLKIIGVTIGQIQGISEEEALLEGINKIHTRDGDYFHYFRTDPHPKNWCCPIDAFRELWDKVNGPDAWERNDWVFKYKYDIEE